MNYNRIAKALHIEGQNPYKALSLGLIGIIVGFGLGKTVIHNKGYAPALRQKPAVVQKEARPLKKDYKPYVPPTPAKPVVKEEFSESERMKNTLIAHYHDLNVKWSTWQSLYKQYGASQDFEISAKYGKIIREIHDIRDRLPKYESIKDKAMQNLRDEIEVYAVLMASSNPYTYPDFQKGMKESRQAIEQMIE